MNVHVLHVFPDRVGYPSTLDNLNVRFPRESQSNFSNEPKNIQTETD